MSGPDSTMTVVVAAPSRRCGDLDAAHAAVPNAPPITSQFTTAVTLEYVRSRVTSGR